MSEFNLVTVSGISYRTGVLEAMKRLGKTICMPQARFDNWIKALRSGSYRQAEGVLHDVDDNSFCCLGVEQHCNTHTTENDQLPSLGYLKKNNILYMNNGEAGMDPKLVFEDGGPTSAAEMNDEGFNFEDIADRLVKAFISTEDLLKEMENPTIKT